VLLPFVPFRRMVSWVPKPPSECPSSVSLYRRFGAQTGRRAWWNVGLRC
jgi:hypothetical protein